MQSKLPVRLEREPLIDAVFEVRFRGVDALPDILPGFLFHEFDGKAIITRLPAADLPKPMRAANPELQYAPTQRLEMDQYLISIGDQNVVISCKLPYPKWPGFKTTILDVISRIQKVRLKGEVLRYSIKYVNIIPGQTLADQVAKIQMEINLGNVKVGSDQLSLRVHRNENGIIHILSVITGAQGTLPNGTIVSGSVVDIDSICEINAPNFEVFVSLVNEGLEGLRQANKAKFFSCLTDIAIQEMGPVYE